MAEGLRERKRARTRRRIADAALARFLRDGFDATSVRQICDDAEVAVSTFYNYFPSKEATVFPDDDDRADRVATVLATAPVGEPPQQVLRAGSRALAEHDVAIRAAMVRRSRVVSREPAVAAYAARRQAEHIARFTTLFADRLGLDPDVDMRPGLAVAMTVGAVNAAWSAWLTHDGADLMSLLNQAHDVVDAGLERTLAARG